MEKSLTITSDIQNPAKFTYELSASEQSFIAHNLFDNHLPNSIYSEKSFSLSLKSIFYDSIENPYLFVSHNKQKSLIVYVTATFLSPTPIHVPEITKDIAIISMIFKNYYTYFEFNNLTYVDFKCANFHKILFEFRDIDGIPLSMTKHDSEYGDKYYNPTIMNIQLRSNDINTLRLAN